MSKENEATFHGGFVRNRGEGRGVRVARVPDVRLAHPDPESAQERSLAILGPDTPTEVKRAASRPIQARKTGLACLGIPSDILSKGSPEYARAIRLANKWKKARVKELYIAHGYVSSGVHSLLGTAALALAASKFCYALATESNPGLMKTASSLGDSYRQNELSAWELCARESVVYKRNESAKDTMPWMVSNSPPIEVKKGPGRPRKDAAVQSALKDLEVLVEAEN